MTDREKLIELVGEIVVPYFAEQIADHLLANGVTVQNWIPVTERLPEKTGTYIVTTQPGAVTTSRFYEARSIPERMWREEYDLPANWQSNRKVTHWMPLPEPPDMSNAKMTKENENHG